MPHICMDEILMFLAIFPFIGIYFRRVHAWYHAKFHHKCHEETCNAAHAEHDTAIALNKAIDSIPLEPELKKIMMSGAAKMDPAKAAEVTATLNKCVEEAPELTARILKLRGDSNVRKE